ncbi:hypothetical protein [Streptosporangium sp. NPDC000396]|uniref:hypothetical protein n=1 Tax=Streptosporangium sp. NPDC000396 TaxID=3366185 RepID=UPI0036B5061C
MTRPEWGADISGLTASTRKRKRAAVASFCKWAVRHDLIAANPMDKIDTIKVPKTLPRLERPLALSRRRTARYRR